MKYFNRDRMMEQYERCVEYASDYLRQAQRIKSLYERGVLALICEVSTSDDYIHITVKSPEDVLNALRGLRRAGVVRDPFFAHKLPWRAHCEATGSGIWSVESEEYGNVLVILDDTDKKYGGEKWSH